MFFLYYFLAFFLYIFSLPLLIVLIFKKKYKTSLLARFFLYKNPMFSQKRYWFHACSLGETRALRGILKKFEKVNFSVITQTGFDEAKKYKNAEVRFLPFEIFLPFWIRPCRTLVVMEAELWYMLFYIAKRRCEKTVLLNARISDKSYPKYLKFKWFYKKIFENIDIVLAQSEIDKQRLLTLGAKRVEVVGNIKTYFKPLITKKYKKSKPLIVLASTHKNEEKMILSKIDLNKYQVVVVPRHPERFDEVYEIMNKFGEVKRISSKFQVLSSKSEVENIIELEGDLILMDKMGELINLYAVADVVILCGSFVDNVGGHNPIEPAFFNVPIISGKYYFNQKALYKEVENIEVCNIDDIPEKLEKIKKTSIKNKVDLDLILEYIK
ncbi:lipid IV(A) 3-deoxy-D-manno-octulosonic acid transferase [Caminibacter profundus]